MPEMNKLNTTRPALLPRHLADLRRSGLTAEQIERGGFYSESDPAAVARLLNWKGGAERLGPCLVIPFTDAAGEPTGYARLKPDNPRESDGKRVKYESPKGRPNRVYLPPGTRAAALDDPAVPLVVTEGEKKAAAADAAGFACLGLVGVYGWQERRPRGADGKAAGPRVLTADLAPVAWAGRRVTIVFDSDAASNRQVLWAEWHLSQTLTAAGAIVTAVRLPAAQDGSKQGVDDFLVARGPDALRRLVPEANPVTEPGRRKPAADAPPDDAGKKPSAADVLAGIGLGFELWHDADQRGYATKGRNTLPVRSTAFRLMLVTEYRKLTGGKVPNAEAVAAAANVIDGAAVCDGPERQAAVRVAHHNGRVYLHVADAAGTVVEVDAAGWRVCENPPVRFLKPAGMLPLPAPAPGGSMAALKRFVNLPDENFPLAVAWLTAALGLDGPCPVAVLVGEQGSAKSTTARVFKALIDPAKGDGRGRPKDERDLMIAARNGWLLPYDNLSALPGWLSDSFCRLVTGGSLNTRRLYTDDEEVIFEARRPVVLNGITDFVEASDLLERALLFRHPPIPPTHRRAEKQFWAEFEAARPTLLGAFLTRVSRSLRALPGVALTDLPRMADFATFAVAGERGAGEPERFATAYAANQAGSHEQALHASPVAAALSQLMRDRDEWAGTATDLLAALTGHVPAPPPRDWPKQANRLTGELRRLAPDLRRARGLDVDCDSKAGDDRCVRVSRVQHPTATYPRDVPDGPDDRTAAPSGRSAGEMLFSETDISAIF